MLSNSIMYFSDEQLFLETGENVSIILRYSNNTVRAIMYLFTIDCFEVFIERPSNLLARAQTFSS